MITIATYSTPTDAHIAKGLLESRGIHCQLRNEILAQALPLGVELLVDESDAEQALEILDEAEL